MIKLEKKPIPRCFPIPTPGPFHHPPIHPPGIPTLPSFPSNPGVTVSLRDRFNAARLPQTLNTPGVKLREALGGERATVTFGKNGQPDGPEGQPLLTVKRGKDTLYVDPNTNQYYKANDSGALYFRKPSSQSVTGPYPLPANAQFSNSYFSPADDASLGRGFLPIRRDDGFTPIKKPALPGFDANGVDLSKIVL